MAKLTAKQKRFCDEYLIDLNLQEKDRHIMTVTTI